jgi:hypothetical protein
VRNWRLHRLISGGQTGVDRGALDAALEAGISVGGWCPRGFRAEDGRVPDKYSLRESESPEYSVRTELNVRDSDGTLILHMGSVFGGTRETRRYAKVLGRPYLAVNLASEKDPERASRWLEKSRLRILNVAGPRESSVPGIQAEAYRFMKMLLSA